MEDVLIHTGQHYDREMSNFFFDELELPKPAHNLGIGSGSQAHQTAAMMVRLEEIMTTTSPDMVLVHGDTNSTLAGALTAAKLSIPVAHNESGMRSFNRAMPEEINRVLTDHCSSLLFCPTEASRLQLAKESITSGVHVIGDVQYDVAMLHYNRAFANKVLLEELGVTKGQFVLVTLHRPYTVDNSDRLQSLLTAFSLLKDLVILPLHPRTKARLDEFHLTIPPNVKIVKPVGYFDMMTLEISARMIMTDSGGVQKEAYFHGVPCLTLRPETEWIETVEAGWNLVVDTNIDKILAAADGKWCSSERKPIFGDGHAAEKLAIAIRDF